MKKTHSVDALFTFLLFGLFLTLSLLLLAIGGDVYHKVADRTEQNSEARIALAYVANKVRAARVPGACGVEERGGKPAIVIREQVEDKAYETVIYYVDGAVQEVFLRSGAPFVPKGGSVILEASGFEVQESDALLTVTITGKSGRAYTRRLLREVAP